MAERPNQDWSTRFLKSLGPNFRYEVNNPQMGCGGTDVYRMYGVSSDGSKFSIGADQAGKLKVNSDQSIEIVAGSQASKGGEDVLIASLNGNLSIVADKNGTIKIKGSNILINAESDLDIIAGNDINFKANNINFNANKMDTEALDGNMIPFSKTWIARVYDGTFVGVDVIAQFIGRLVPGG